MGCSRAVGSSALWSTGASCSATPHGIPRSTHATPVVAVVAVAVAVLVVIIIVPHKAVFYSKGV